MKIKTENIEFLSFSDGVCNIFTDDGTGSKENKYENLGFSNKVLGFKRFFQAAANQMAINKVISIPMVQGIDTYDKVCINKIIYDIKLIQDKYDTNPPSIDLTLQGGS